MFSSAIQASLAEVLEVRNGLLMENETWAVLKSSLSAVRRLFKDGRACFEQKPCHVVMPDTLMLCHDGQIRISSIPWFQDFDVSSECKFIPPECLLNDSYSEESIEKIYIYGLGLTLHLSTEFQKPPVNAILSSTLDNMCSDIVSSRPTLIALSSICEHGHQIDEFSHRCIKKLHGSVFGSNFSLSSDKDPSPRVLAIPEDLCYVPQNRSGQIRESSNESVESVAIHCATMVTTSTQTHNNNNIASERASLASLDIVSASHHQDEFEQHLDTGQSSRSASACHQGETVLPSAQHHNEAELPSSSFGLAFPRNKKKIFGAEFLRTEPTVNLFLPDSREADEASLRNVEVILLNGKNLNITCRFDCTGRQLYDFVTYHLALPEPTYFGLTFVREGEHFFISAETKLHKMAPVEWKGQSKRGYRQTATFKTYFHVKFFVDDLRIFRQHVSVHLLYLELRRSIIEERLSCTEDQALLLAGLALRAEYGDRDHDAREAPVSHYLSPRILKRHESGELIVSQYLQLSQVSVEDAEQRFIKVAMQLPEYGIHFYELHKSRKDSDKQSVWLGICVRGVLTAERRGNSVLVVTGSFQWQSIEKISFNQHKFSLSLKQLNANENIGKPKVNKLIYQTDSYKKGQYLLKLCTESHHFQMMVRMSQASRQVEDLESLAESFSHSSCRASLTIYDVEEETRQLSASLSSNESLHISSTTHQLKKIEDTSNSNQLDSVNVRHDHQRDLSKKVAEENLDQVITTYLDNIPPPVLDDDVIATSTRAPLKVVHQSIEQHTRDNTLQPLVQSNTSLMKSGQGGPEEQPPTPVKQLAIVRRAQSTASSKKNTKKSEAKQQLVKLVLSKSESTAGFGFGIVRDQSTTPSLLRIAQIVPGGIADKDGRLQTGDKLIKVNGQSVAGLTQRDAVEFVRISGNSVKIIVLRSTSVDKLSSSDSVLPTVDVDIFKSNELWPRPSLEDVSHGMPEVVNNDWIESQSYIKMESSVLYSGTQLESLIHQLKLRLTRDDPGEEFKSLKQVLEPDKCTTALEERNRTKNRYRNVLPYDATRVHLSGDEDYINASLVTYNLANVELSLQYIATQDPLPDTVTDFWRMVWEQHVAVIFAMHSSISYLPVGEIGMHCLIENKFRVTLMNKRCLRYFKMSTLQLDDLELPGSSRLVTHVESTSWPEHGVPESSVPVLVLRRLLRTLTKDGDGPVLVHCLTGVGRTATLLAIDIALTLIEHDNEIKFVEIVEELRRQRPAMIQTKSMYCFFHRAVLTALESLSASLHGS